LYLGYKYLNGLEVLVIQYTWPILIVIFSIFLLHEHITKTKILSITLGFFGATLIITKGDIFSVDLSNIKIILLVFLGAVSFALFSVLSKKITINPINAVMVYFLVSIPYSFIFMNLFSSFIIPSKNEWFYIFINGALINGISYIFWIKALQKLHASFIAPFIFFIPIISMFLIIFLFNERIYFVYFVGLFFIILAGFINTLSIKNKHD
jgi:drug/metabolite transporter (DMT)-like permease